MRPIVATVAATALSLLLAACQQAAAPAPDPNAKKNAEAEKQLVAYRQLVQANSVELAASIGRDIVNRFPGTPAAQEVMQTLPGFETQVKNADEAERLAALWMYQSGEGSDGGKQHVASIYSSEPATEPARVRLLYRRHANWGQSVYLHGGDNGFECGSPCRIAIRFDDGAAENWVGEIPSGGENAIFVEEDDKFLARIKGVKKIAFDVKREGMGPQTLVFETGGYDASKWPAL